MNPLFSSYEQTFQKVVQNNNSIVFSSLSEFYEPIQSFGFAIKYVAEGSELYLLDGIEHHVEKGNYLLCNSSKKGHVAIESRKKVQGICINIDTDLMLDVISTIIQPNTSFSNKQLGTFFCTPDFLETQYQAKDTIVGKTLSHMSIRAQNGEMMLSDFKEDIFYFLAENIVQDQIPVFKQLQSLPFLKSATKKDLYKKVKRGKEMIDEYYKNAISVKDVAKESCLSEYHFFRLFKNVYGNSPHQYIIQKRLEHAMLLLQDDAYSVSDVAIETGFSDIYSFSKSFKKRFGYSPSSCINSRKEQKK